MGGYVYLICDPGQDTYKIGVTRDLTQKRLKYLQTGNSSQLHIIHSVYVEFPFRVETMLHNKFKNKKAYGEWFYLDQDDIKNFKKSCDEAINIIEALKDNPFFGKNLK